MRLIKVSTRTDVYKLAGTLHSFYTSDPDTPIVMRTIGAGALNQAVKAATIANKHLVVRGVTILLAPAFSDVEDNTTAISLNLKFQKI